MHKLPLKIRIPGMLFHPSSKFPLWTIDTLEIDDCQFTYCDFEHNSRGDWYLCVAHHFYKNPFQRIYHINNNNIARLYIERNKSPNYILNSRLRLTDNMISQLQIYTEEMYLKYA